MVLSEKTPEDKQKLKNGIMGVFILLALGSFGPLIISEVTGVDVDKLCVREVDNANAECIEKAMNGEIKDAVLEGLGWMSIIVAVVAMIGFLVAGVKY